jgi:predicted acyltransferase
MIQTKRIASADVYRGFVMFLMMAETLRLSKMEKNFPNSSFWSFLAFHQSHVPWVGCSLHDLIQPSFSFLVGVVLPYSLAKKNEMAFDYLKSLGIALKRAIILIFLGIFLRSQHESRTYFTFEDTLTQIGLGYVFLFLLGHKSLKFIATCLLMVIMAYWAAFALYPLPSANFNYANSGVPNNWEGNLAGFAAHWNKNANFAWAFDQWFLNLFPRHEKFYFNEGGYSTLSFIPTLATMILGLIAGKILKSDNKVEQELKYFILLGLSGLCLGLILNHTGICPIVKRIWTPSWVLYSGGWCFLFLALFYYLVDLKQKGNWFYIFKVIGMNSIAAYLIADALGGYISKSLKIHLGQNYAEIVGTNYQHLFHGSILLFIFWLILYWLYKKQIFIKI